MTGSHEEKETPKTLIQIRGISTCNVILEMVIDTKCKKRNNKIDNSFVRKPSQPIAREIALKHRFDFNEKEL